MSGALSATTAAAVSAGLISAGTAAALPAAGTVLAGASLASTAVSGIGAVTSGMAASASAGYNSTVASDNAAIAKQNSAFAGAEGEQNVAASSAKTRAEIGATVADQGASGISVNTGSNVDVRQSEAKLGMLNSLNIRSQAARQAYGYQTQATAFEGEASLARSQKRASIIGGAIGGFGSVLSGIGDMAKYKKWLAAGGY